MPLINGDGLIGEMIIGSCLGHSHHEMLNFKSFHTRKTLVRVAMGFGRADFRLLEKLIS